LRTVSVLGILAVWGLTGCGLSGGQSISSATAHEKTANPFLGTRINAGPCPSFLILNPTQPRIDGIWLTSRALPFKMHVAGEQQTLPGLRDVSQILLVLDDWKITACRSRRKSDPSGGGDIDRKLALVDDYVHAFALVLSTPYAKADEAEAGIRNWVEGVRDRLLTELLRGPR